MLLVLFIYMPLHELSAGGFLVSHITLVTFFHWHYILTGSVGATNMNATSSRSHAIFTITIERSEKGLDGQQHLRMGKLHMVDLAVSFIHKSSFMLLQQCFCLNFEGL